MLLYIIRHGEPDYATDSLTELGKQQAAAVAQRFSRLDEIYSSPLGRAVQTAQPTCEKLGLAHTIEPWMSEDMAWDDLHHLDDTGNKNWAFGCQGSKLIQIAGNWHDSPLFARCKAAEQGYRRIATASDEFLSRLGYTRSGKIYRATNPNNKRIAAFCHHGLGTSWLSHMLNIPPHIFWASFNIAHSSVSIINFGNTADGDVSPQCVCLSDISHIFKNNLPVNMPGV